MRIIKWIFRYINNLPARGFYAFYLLSILIVGTLWLNKGPVPDTAEYRVMEDSTVVHGLDDAMLDSAAPASPDTVYISQPQVIVIPSTEPKGFLSTTNEVITMVVGIFNLTLLIIQVKNKRLV